MKFPSQCAPTDVRAAVHGSVFAKHNDKQVREVGGREGGDEGGGRGEEAREGGRQGPPSLTPSPYPPI